jgi:hypothetical protein
MTDFDPTPDDELVSAYLDGEATPAERAVVEGDPRLLARVSELRAVATAVGAPVSPADAARDRLIAQALAAAPPVAPVVSLDAARRRRQRIGVTIASVAAALVALLALPVLLDDGSSDDQTAAVESADDGAEDAADPDDGAAPESGADDEASDDTWDGESVGEPDATTPRSTVLNGAGGPEVLPVAPAADADDLGAFATRTEAQLAISEAIDAALVESELLRESGMLEYRALTDGACDAAVRAGDDELVGLVYAATFDLAGVAHQVLVYDLIQTGAQNGTHRVYEVTVPACAEVSVETI